MAKQPPEDLFADTTMSFGDHLEELRSSLFRAMVGLLLGFLVALFFADRVVLMIQQPLMTALNQYYLDTAKDRLEEEMGQTLSPETAAYLIENRRTFEDVFVSEQEAAALMAQLNAAPTGNEGPPDSPTDSAGGIDRLPSPDTRMFKVRIWRPLSARITALSAQEPFMIWLKAALITGLILSSPYVFWQLWNFVAAGLYPHEKRYVHVFLPFSLVLFWMGACMAFFFVFEPVLSFLFSFNRSMQIEQDPRISEWISFVLFLPLGFGIAFQLPLVMLFLNRIGILELEVYLSKWRVAILIIFVISMLLTPADPVSMLLMAMPLTVLYFLGVALCKWMPANRNPYRDTYEP